MYKKKYSVKRKRTTKRRYAKKRTFRAKKIGTKMMGRGAKSVAFK